MVGTLDEEQAAIVASVTMLGTYALMAPPGPWSGCYDMNGDGPIDMADVQAVAGRWHDPSQYDPDYDVVPDGVIDILDVMKVVIQLGEHCGGTAPGASLLSGSGLLLVGPRRCWARRARRAAGGPGRPDAVYHP